MTIDSEFEILTAKGTMIKISAKNYDEDVSYFLSENENKTLEETIYFLIALLKAQIKWKNNDSTT